MLILDTSLFPRDESDHEFSCASKMGLIDSCWYTFIRGPLTGVNNWTHQLNPFYLIRKSRDQIHHIVINSFRGITIVGIIFADSSPADVAQNQNDLLIF